VWQAHSRKCLLLEWVPFLVLTEKAGPVFSCQRFLIRELPEIVMLRKVVGFEGTLWIALVGAMCCILLGDSRYVWSQSAGSSGITEREMQALEESCDRAAGSNLRKMASALERLKNELLDLNCDPDAVFAKLWQSDGPLVISYLIGPYYGWRGTTGACAVRIRIVGDELHSSSLRGKSLDGKTKARKIFRVSLTTLKELPSIVGPCIGEGYYRDMDDYCGISSMIEEKGCRLVKPSMRHIREMLGREPDQIFR
jgi:hypothetical protein